MKKPATIFLITLLFAFSFVSCATKNTNTKPLLKEEKISKDIYIDFNNANNSNNNINKTNSSNIENDNADLSSDINEINGFLDNFLNEKTDEKKELENLENKQHQKPSPRFTNSLTTYNFEKGKAFPLIISTQSITDIILEEGETPIGDILIDDTSNFIIDTSFSYENSNKVYHIILRCIEAKKGESRAILPTDKRTYYFNITSTDSKSMLAVKFKYPNGNNNNTNNNILDNKRLCPIDSLNFNYILQGSNKIRPIAAFSDGKSTYIQFTSSFLTNNYSPALYLESKNGFSIINYTIKANMYITDFVLEENEYFVLIQDSEKAYIKRGI